MKRLPINGTDSLADVAVLDTGIAMAKSTKTRAVARESLKGNLIELAFAEAADYDDIHRAILGEHRSEQDIARYDEYQYGENDVCFQHAA